MRAAPPPPRGGAYVSGQVDFFSEDEIAQKIASLGLDDNALEALSKLTVADQARIVGDINPSVARNPSAVLWKKIRDLGLSLGSIQADPLALQEKVSALNLDERALDALGALTPEDQAKVLAQVNPAAAVNHSAVLWAKIRQLGLSRGSANPQDIMPPMGTVAGLRDRSRSPRITTMGHQAPGAEPHSGFEDLSEIAAVHTLQAYLAASGVQSTQALLAARALHAHPGFAALVGATRQLGYSGGGAIGAASVTPPMNGQGGCAGLRQGLQSGLVDTAPLIADDVLGVLDEKARRSVAELTPEERIIVTFLVAQHSSMKNPSAFAWSKVKQVRENPLEAKIEYFNKVLDEKSIKALTELPKETRDAILMDINLTVVRNLSACVWSKVRDAQKGPAVGASIGSFPRQGIATEAAMGLDSNDAASAAGVTLDDRCSMEFRKLPMETQRQILAMIDFSTCKNVSAFVWSKIKQMR